jgi:hypothetical protein
MVMRGSVFLMVITFVFLTVVCAAKGWTGPPDCHEYGDDQQQKAYEECLIRLLAENHNDRDDWLEIILYFKNNIFPIANDIYEGQHKDALWQLNTIVVKKESMSYIIKYILPQLVEVDKETLEKLDSAVHSQAYDVVLHITGFSDIGAKILLDIKNGGLFYAVMRGTLYGALSALRMDSLFPKISAIFDAFTSGNYWEGMVRLAALPIPIAKELLWLVPIPPVTHPIVSVFLDAVHDIIVDYFNTPGFLRPLRNYIYSLVTSDAMIRLVSRSVSTVWDISCIAVSKIAGGLTAVIQEVLQDYGGVRRLH